MQICPSCRHPQLNGIIFCDVCGDELIAGGRCLPLQSAQTASDTSPGAPAIALSALSQQWALLLPEVGRRILLPPLAKLVIGRGSAVRLDINLDPEGTVAGVSATHAMLLALTRGWAIQDLGSTNGTYVNLSRISSASPTPIAPGDRIHLGALLITLKNPELA